MGWWRAVWAAIKRAQKWPGLATPALIARTLAAALMAGGAVSALVTTIAPAGIGTVAVQYGNALVAGALGIVVLMIGGRFTLWQLNLLVLTGLAMITVAVLNSEGASAVSFATLYVFAACAAFFVTWPTAVIYLSLAAGCCVTALILAPAAPWWTGVVTALITVVIGTIIAILGRMVAKAEVDDATGLPNRRGFDRLISAEISRSRTAGSGPAVIFISVEGLAAIQEEFGVRAANTLTRQMIESWRGMLGPEQILARRGDDEFAVLLPETGEQDALAVAERLRTKSTREFSAGVSAWKPRESTSPVMARADTALRRARSTGRNRTMLESADLPPVAVQLRDALTADTIDVRYQPIVSLDDDAVVGVEALLRWSPPSDSNLPAIEVIRVAEENKLIAALDQYVLRRACLDAQWIQKQSPRLRLIMGVNVSGLELVQEGYVARVFDTLEATGWPAEQLVLEVTESVIDVDRPSSINALHKLRARGIRIAIDDFGTGYSTLSRLQQLPTDILKLDATFTASISPLSPTAPPLLLGVAGLVEALRLPILAEGVETAHQASVLRAMGCPLAQGYYFGRAQTREAVVAAIARAPR